SSNVGNITPLLTVIKEMSSSFGIEYKFISSVKLPVERDRSIIAETVCTAKEPGLTFTTHWKCRDYLRLNQTTCSGTDNFQYSFPMNCFRRLFQRVPDMLV